MKQMPQRMPISAHINTSNTGRSIHGKPTADYLLSPIALPGVVTLPCYEFPDEGRLMREAGSQNHKESRPRWPPVSSLIIFLVTLLATNLVYLCIGLSILASRRFEPYATALKSRRNAVTIKTALVGFGVFTLTFTFLYFAVLLALRCRDRRQKSRKEEVGTASQEPNSTKGELGGMMTYARPMVWGVLGGCFIPALGIVLRSDPHAPQLHGFEGGHALAASMLGFAVTMCGGAVIGVACFVLARRDGPRPQRR